MNDEKRGLLWHGMLLFVLGLLTGLVEARFRNPRLGLSAHLQAILNGIFLILLGTVWAEVRLSPRWKSAAYWCGLCGGYGGWLVTTFAAIFGTISLTTLASSGPGGAPWQEGLVRFGFLLVGITITSCSLFVLWGLRPGARV
jgi:hydroxylaminobenzene mutase